MGALYRKYRPGKFSEVIGHEAVVTLLRNEIVQNTPSHAYLFSGVRGVGKTTFARLIAKALDCQNRKKIDGKSKKGSRMFGGVFPGDPCGECDSCVAIDKGIFPDVLEIDAASHRGIDEIRSIKERVAFAPMRGQYKVYIIDEAHMLTREAFNALLKTLEEPPEFVVFILCTTEPGKLPETIISRCQWFELRLATPDQLATKLKEIAKAEKTNVDEEVFRLVARVANGSFRDGESLFGSLLSAIEQGKSVTLKEARKILNIPGRMALSKLFSLILGGEAILAKQKLEKLKERGYSADKVIDGLIEEGSARLFGSADVCAVKQVAGLQRELVEAKRMSGYLPDAYIAIEIVIAENAKEVDEPTDGAKEERKPAKPVRQTLKKDTLEVTQKAEKPKSKATSKLQKVDDWNKVVLAIEKTSCQLATILSSSLVYFNDGLLRLVVKNGFELGIVSSAKNQALLRKEVSALLSEVNDIICEKGAQKTAENLEEQDIGAIFN